MSDYVPVSIGGIEQFLSLPRLAVRSALTSVGYREAAVPGAFRLCQLILSGAIEFYYTEFTKNRLLVSKSSGIDHGLNSRKASFSCNSCTKHSEQVLIEGRHFGKEGGFLLAPLLAGDEEDVNVDLTEQKKANDVKVSEVNHGMAPPSHLLDSEIPQKPKSETGLRGDGETPLSSRRADKETMMSVADGTIEVNFGD
ncbi:hypothetical protein F2Q70_00034849 [Brassica cretica]|uniref:Uncharacterized protein n=1 Tax=Brassica cretica TaxID=69181 RepID=A0A8S9JYP7_BRACR|nr:hypothetical protein F2Q68_00029746 [Brassica cretica]KAF2586698.1 hypothetical protein F2Q70_00034849 [Brassica cretica]